MVQDQEQLCELWLKQLAQMIYEHCGLNYRDSLDMLSSKIAARLLETRLSIREYIDRLHECRLEWEPLIQCVTINETYFFREEQQLRELADIARRRLEAAGSLTIWSAACSSGEEPYSIAMTLHAAGLPLERIAIHATDINARVLEHAVKGRYHKNSLCFRRTPDEMLRAYFAEEGDEYALRPGIRAAVRFRQLNLLDRLAVCSMDQADIILCRNVLIYFDEVTVARVLSGFDDRLREGGYLFLGHAETMRGAGLGFESISREHTFYYRKQGAAQ